MANWTGDLKTAKEYKTSGGFTEYCMYINKEFVTAGRLESGTVLGLSYDSKKDAMKIISCSAKPEAEGKYIKSPQNIAGTTTVKATKDKNGKSIKASTEAKSTKDKKTGKTTAQNTDEDGNTSTTTIVDEISYVDDAFIDNEYYEYIDSDTYNANLSQGLRVADLRGVLGMPHQFTALTDPRIENSNTPGDEESFGRLYAERIVKHIPLLLMTPGVPTFMSGYSENQKSTIIDKLIGNTIADIESLVNTTKGKYYSLKYAYTEYFHYVNAMLRSAAVFLEIDGESIDRNNKTLGDLDWLYETAGGEKFGHKGLKNFLGPYAGCIAFYADAGTSVDESFGNGTTESQLASALNNITDTGRELNFLVGNVGGAAGVNLSKYLGADDINGKIDEIKGTLGSIGLAEGNIFSNIVGKAVTLLAGGRMIFPEIWSDSQFSRSYSCSMKLVSPSGDKLSIYLNILVPFYHLLGFVLPRQADGQSYFSPFLVRAFYKGLFNIDMGIITGLSASKGAEGEWTIDGLPTVLNVSFDIKDMYDSLFMSKQESLTDSNGLMSNIQELDYIANSCGINVNDQEVYRTLKMYKVLGFGAYKDKVGVDIFGGIAQYFNQKMNNIFGVFK